MVQNLPLPMDQCIAIPNLRDRYLQDAEKLLYQALGYLQYSVDEEKAYIGLMNYIYLILKIQLCSQNKQATTSSRWITFAIEKVEELSANLERRYRLRGSYNRPRSVSVSEQSTQNPTTVRTLRRVLSFHDSPRSERRPLHLPQQEVSDPNHKGTDVPIQYALHGPITEAPTQHMSLQNQAPTSRQSVARIPKIRKGDSIHFLPQQLKQQLFKSLDKEDSSTDWRELALELGYNYTEWKDYDKFRKNGCPTEAVIHQWEADSKQKMTVVQLYSVLEAINHTEATSLLKGYLEDC